MLAPSAAANVEEQRGERQREKGRKVEEITRSGQQARDQRVTASSAAQLADRKMEEGEKRRRAADEVQAERLEVQARTEERVDDDGQRGRALVDEVAGDREEKAGSDHDVRQNRKLDRQQAFAEGGEEELLQHEKRGGELRDPVVRVSGYGSEEIGVAQIIGG